ncbi:MAG: YqaA family protein [Salibacteraceae bacterium]
MEAHLELGYWGLFVASFLAATVLPLGSEAVFSGLLLGGADPVWCILLATAGNWLGGMSTYLLGWLGKWEWITRWLRIAPEKTQKWQRAVQRFGSWFAVLCWMPIIGDPIALALGLAKSPLGPVSVWMLVGKGLRYLILAGIVMQALDQAAFSLR